MNDRNVWKAALIGIFLSIAGLLASQGINPVEVLSTQDRTPNGVFETATLLKQEQMTSTARWQTETPTEEVRPLAQVCATRNMNIRHAPSLFSEVVDSLAKDNHILVFTDLVETNDGFYWLQTTFDTWIALEHINTNFIYLRDC